MSSSHINRAGLFDARPDAQPFLSDAEYVKRGAEFSSLTGIAMTHLGNGDIFYAVDTTAGNITVTLPAVADTVGQHHIVKRISGGSNQCNIVPAEGTAILDGSATHSIAAQYGVRCYFSDGDAWRGTIAPSGLYLTSASASAAYVPIPAAWPSFTPTVASSGGTLGSAGTDCRFLRQGKSGFFRIDVLITSVGTGTGAILLSNLPFTPAAGLSSGFGGCETAANGHVVGLTLGPGANGVIRHYDASTNLIILNRRYTIDGCLEVT